MPPYLGPTLPESPGKGSSLWAVHPRPNSSISALGPLRVLPAIPTKEALWWECLGIISGLENENKALPTANRTRDTWKLLVEVG